MAACCAIDFKINQTVSTITIASTAKLSMKKYQSNAMQRTNSIGRDGPALTQIHGLFTGDAVGPDFVLVQTYFARRDFARV
ncbi:hypothetical protein VN12_21510 [Pirellula sp. SH-Sr6A]|nr:hypothetical protein VN12_21510 [Pirellula sp. SH-Sr6A]